MSNCAHCGQPIPAPKREKPPGKDNGTRIAHGVWLAHVEADPYCSTECCKAAHYVTYFTEGEAA